ncbi:putative vacuolar morphogenesis protein 7 [Podospora fimiseda]|uniref:Vacuolar morphogenesis protein 7 n=1 Tax=Podospora fimiseda TaxID=252190 RepID=A0AAN7H1K6_9PEZI|nr:putative vacuolar morphogenesis protein 7 [Podospora fimiseda]
MAPPAEISIPTTSLSTPADGSKSYTLYNITLRLPLRSFVVQKRYNDFLALHNALTSLVGSPPPAPLPSKSWFRSTVSSPELTENRRQGLEAYLRAIAEPPDRRWRDTPAWRAFLNLPAGGRESVSGLSMEGGIPAIGLREANLAAASDPGTWLDLHREMKGTLHEARVALGRRDAAVDNGGRVEAGAQAKRALIRAGGLLGALGEGLKVMKDGKSGNRLGEGELRRRRDLLAAARVERDGLDKLSSSLGNVVAVGGGSVGVGGAGRGVASASDRAALMGNGGGGSSSSGVHRGSGGGRVLGAPLPETERTRELDNDGVLLLQRDTMAEQDQEVDALMKIVRRQKEMGLAINDEVNRHIEMLDRLNDDVDHVQSKLGPSPGRSREEVASSYASSLTSFFSMTTTRRRRVDDDDEDDGNNNNNRNQPGGGLIDAVLLLIVRCVLAGVQGYALMEWLLGRISVALVWVVELVMLLLQP